jgi:hypothetical protein
MKLRIMNIDLIQTIEKYDISETELINRITTYEKEQIDVKSNKGDITIDTKISIGMVIIWLQLFMLYQHTILEPESFVIVNICIMFTTILMSFF